MLCICRGLQVLNVVCGGTLHVHLPERFGERVAPPPAAARHERARGARSTRTAASRASSARREVEVRSWHHQAIDRLGDGLRPVAWAEDGVIEAVEHVEHPWCIGVQWHPEMQLEDAAQQRLFGADRRASDEHGWSG